jgi:hypothetical protein
MYLQQCGKHKNNDDIMWRDTLNQCRRHGSLLLLVCTGVMRYSCLSTAAPHDVLRSMHELWPVQCDIPECMMWVLWMLWFVCADSAHAYLSRGDMQ